MAQVVNAVDCRPFFKRLLGKIAFKEKSLYFETRLGVHTFGLSREIDIYILDREGIVVKSFIGAKPNRVFFWHPRYKRVLESEAGKYSFTVGDYVTIELMKMK